MAEMAEMAEMAVVASIAPVYSILFPPGRAIKREIIVMPVYTPMQPSKPP
jgi:hypothetical protein